MKRDMMLRLLLCDLLFVVARHQYALISIMNVLNYIPNCQEPVVALKLH